MAVEQPSFTGFLKASGQAEVWDDEFDMKKFQQFGWRTTTNESNYSTDTLVGNWNEEKFDVKSLSKAKPLPSQYDHYFETTYKAGYSQPKKNPQTLPKSRSTETYRAFPGHQPSLDLPQAKQQYNSFLTTSREAYGSP
ncbi:PREDICTED: UPF0686 protein C11orf1 homolog [Amphimedon queenslandica]|uniref:Uncharacterized protein n=1 Tax=Amphimedon queenslandica TaxID=400682 RepID=A0A1X7UQH5_AMPQE|nr:PREDICTED: UPF0686 protein C11orf1 homolog [Amphimedon queenslandica]|eukprot:XP_003387083.1 PREDICTED: UPF0686 protein C11orf1 homolog [Amphimedon queenslandica]